MIFFKKVDLSASVTCSDEKDGSTKPASSHCFAWGCAITSFFRGSLNLSSSLREALPPMLRTKDRARSGPRCSMAFAKPACTAGSSGLTETKAACQPFLVSLPTLLRKGSNL